MPKAGLTANVSFRSVAWEAATLRRNHLSTRHSRAVSRVCGSTVAPWLRSRLPEEPGHGQLVAHDERSQHDGGYGEALAAHPVRGVAEAQEP